LASGKKIFYGWWIVLASFFISLYTSAVVFWGVTDRKSVV
jgi:hypothetical protein